MQEYSQPPFGPALSHRGLRIRFQVTERTGSSGFAPKDVSDARWDGRVRAWSPEAATTFVYDEQLAKGAESAEGWFDHYLALGDDAHEALIWELVEVDTQNVDASTPTGKRETVLILWRQAVLVGAKEA